MFLENSNGASGKKGWIEVISGSMFSGKTEELIRRLKRARLSKQKVAIFKPITDTRYDKRKVVSHDANHIPSTAVDAAAVIPSLSEGMDVVGIDEAQFFDKELVTVCNELANRGVRVIAAGLDMDYNGHPFGCVPDLMAIAEYATKVHAICMRCGELANYSHRITKEKHRVIIGAKDHYEPLCRTCFIEVSLNTE